MLRFIPKPIKRLLIRVYLYATTLLHPYARVEIALSLGKVLPKNNGFVRGGRVKLLHLRERFGDRNFGFNLLYVVSSGLPSNPNLWIRILRKAGIKIVWNQNGVAYPAWAKTKERIERINAPIGLLKQADFIIYQSNFCKESTDKWIGQTKAPHQIVYNCVDTNIFSPPQNPPPPKPLQLLVMGTHMTPEKVLIPLETLKILRDKNLKVRLSIIGPYEWPNAETQINKAIENLGLKNFVSRHGKFLQKDAPEMYRQHHIFIHLKYMDPCPTSVIEAMSCGLPVIGSKSGGMPELVPETAGALLDVPKDWEKLHYPTAQSVAEAIKIVSGNLPKFSQEARRHANANFGISGWLDTHNEIFKRVLNLK